MSLREQMLFLGGEVKLERFRGRGYRAEPGDDGMVWRGLGGLGIHGSSRLRIEYW